MEFQLDGVTVIIVDMYHFLSYNVPSVKKTKCANTIEQNKWLVFAVAGFHFVL